MSEYGACVRRATDIRLGEDERKEAFSELVRKFQDMAYACALGILGDTMSAEDAVQDTIISAWRHLDGLRNPEAFPSWLRRRVIWRCWYYRRTSGNTTPFPDELIDQIPDSVDLESEAALNDQNERIRDLIGALPRNAREILTLHYLKEYTHAEIADFLNLSEGTVRKRLYDARSRLRSPLEGMLGIPILARAPSRKHVRGGIKMQNVSYLSADRRDAEEVISGMIKPVWCDNTAQGRSTWEMFCAAIRNDAETLKALINQDPSNAMLEFWYTPAIYFAAREGALEATRVLWEAYPYEEVSKLIELSDERGHVAVADFLRERIDSGHDVDLRLHEAIEDSETEEALRLIDTSPGMIRQADPHGGTPLHLAVRSDNLKIATALLAAGADIDVVDHGGYRPIHYVYWSGNYWDLNERETTEDFVQLLLDQGARDTVTLAVARGDIASVQAFLSREKNLVNDGDTLEKRPLSTAVQVKNGAMVRLLLDHGAEPNLREGRWHPKGDALMWASINDDIDIARMLLDAGADPNAYVDSSGTPTERAVSDTMRGLMYTYGGQPPGAWGYIQQGNLETVAVILSFDDNPFSRETAEYLTTPYTAAVSGYHRQKKNGEPTEAHEAIFNMLIKRNFPMPEVLTECKGYLFTPGHMTRELLERGLSANLPDWQRRTPLHDIANSQASDSNALATADLLLEFGANIDAIDEADQTTPLGIAAYRGNMAFVAYLLEKGADPNKSGAQWSRPLARAERRGHTEIVSALKDRGAK